MIHGLLLLLGVILLDVVLSGDNVLVVAMVARRLPAADRKAAITLGMTAAAILRVVFLLLSAVLLQFQFITVIAGLFLLYVGVQLAIDIIGLDKAEAKPAAVGAGTRLAAMVSIIFADISMSMDNVVAVAGLAHRNLLAMIAGVALSIFLLTRAATWICDLLERWRWLSWVGVILVWVAGLRLLLS